jgi:phytol kinase
MIATVAAMVCVLAVLGALFVALRWYAREKSPDPEIVRKLLHMGMGATSLAFPWLFHEAWPVVTLTVIASAGLFVLRNVRAVRRQFGSVLHGVTRESFGEFFFALGVGGLFVLSEGDKLLFTIPVLTLTVADAVAALIGLRYATIRFATPDGFKSAEGSVAFFTAAFLCCLVPLLLLSRVGRLESLLIALVLAVLVMLLEAISWTGLDNLAIPLVGFELLKSFIALPASALYVRLAVVALVAAFVFFQRRRTTLDDDALLAAVLFGYVLWALDGWAWLVAPATLFIKDKLQTTPPGPAVELGVSRRHDVQAVISVCLPGLVWAMATAASGIPFTFFLSFCVSFGAHLAIFEVTRLKHDQPRATAGFIVWRAAAIGWGLVMLPFLAFSRFTQTGLLETGLALPCIALATLAFYRLQPTLDDCPRDYARWIRQAGAAAAASIFALALVLLAVRFIPWIFR